MQITGLLHRVLPQVTNKTYTTRKIWIKTEAESQYPQTIELETPNNKTELFSNIPIGTRVTCDVNLKGKTWVNKQGEEVCFTTLQVWKVSRFDSRQVEEARHAQFASPTPPPTPTTFIPQPVASDDDQGLPF